MIISVKQQVLKILRICADAKTDVYLYIHELISSNAILEESSLNIELTRNDILKDIPRTYLVNENKKEELELLRILLAFAYIKPSIGYCQGLNFLGAVALKVAQNEEAAF